MSEVGEEWGQREWNEAHFPTEQLDTLGDTWGFRWRGMERWRHARTLKMLKPLLRGTERKEVLEIGCALCDFTVRAWQLNTVNHFCGIDTVPTAIEWASRKFPQFELRVGAIPGIPFDKKFDVILCMEVLCYLEPDGRRETIHNIFDSLGPKGVLVFSGVLDGGVRHHTSEEALGLIGEKFEISQVVYNHWSLYRRLVEGPADSIHARLSVMREKLALAPDDFERWRAAERGRMAALAGALRQLGPAGRWLVSGMMSGTDFVRRRQFLPMLGHHIERMVGGDDAADEIVVVALKP